MKNGALIQKEQKEGDMFSVDDSSLLLLAEELEKTDMELNNLPYQEETAIKEAMIDIRNEIRKMRIEITQRKNKYFSLFYLCLIIVQNNKRKHK